MFVLREFQKIGGSQYNIVRSCTYELYSIIVVLLMSVCVFFFARVTEKYYEPMKYCQVIYVRNILFYCCPVNVGMCLLYEEH